jgi:hypothetical protein
MHGKIAVFNQNISRLLQDAEAGLSSIHSLNACQTQHNVLLASMSIRHKFHRTTGLLSWLVHKQDLRVQMHACVAVRSHGCTRQPLPQVLKAPSPLVAHLSHHNPVPITEPTTYGFAAGQMAHCSDALTGTSDSGTPQGSHLTAAVMGIYGNTHSLVLASDSKLDTQCIAVKGNVAAVHHQEAFLCGTKARCTVQLFIFSPH